jgi:hypothetical protein
MFSFFRILDLVVMPELSWLVAALTPRRPEFDIRACGICGERNGTGAGFLRLFRLPLPILIPSTALYSLIIPLSTLYSLYTHSILNPVKTGEGEKRKKGGR